MALEFSKENMANVEASVLVLEEQRKEAEELAEKSNKRKRTATYGLLIGLIKV